MKSTIKSIHFLYLQPSQMQHSCEAYYFQLLVMHGLREVSVRDIILVLP